MNNIVVLPRKDVAAITSQATSPHIIITITDDNREFVEFDENDNTLGILRLKFGDVMTEKQAEMSRTTLFNSEQAHQIMEFVDAHEKEIETIFVSCDAGISRSSGVALALHRIFAIDPEQISANPRFHPNFHVVNTLVREGMRYGLCLE